MKTVFLDRDGVINKDPGGWTKHSYVTEWRDFHFLPGALEALALLRRSGARAIVISNQAGVSKGHFSQKALDRIDARMRDEVSRSGGAIEASYYCVHKDEDNCACRKPRTGLLEAAAKKYGVSFNDTYFIGDSRVDIIAGRRAGCRTIFLLSGKVSSEEMRTWEEKPDHVFDNLLEAVKWVVAKDKRRLRRSRERGKGKGGP